MENCPELQRRINGLEVVEIAGTYEFGGYVVEEREDDGGGADQSDDGEDDGDFFVGEDTRIHGLVFVGLGEERNKKRKWFFFIFLF